MANCVIGSLPAAPDTGSGRTTGAAVTAIVAASTPARHPRPLRLLIRFTRHSPSSYNSQGIYYSA
ncbi:hypothetical protein GCM10010532_111960 [Dactylosporangium siamense]